MYWIKHVFQVYRMEIQLSINRIARGMNSDIRSLRPAGRMDIKKNLKNLTTPLDYARAHVYIHII